MVINMPPFTFDIKVKGIYGRKNCTKKDLIALINEMSMVYSDAAKVATLKGYDATASDYKKKAKALFEENTRIGAYKF